MGAKEAVKSVNSYLGNLEQQLLDAHAALVRDNALITAETIKNKFLGIGPKQRLLMAVIAEHNERMRALAGQEYAIGTFKRHKVLERHTLASLKSHFNISQIARGIDGEQWIFKPADENECQIAHSTVARSTSNH